MWIDDVKNNPVAQRFIEIAGKERFEEAERQGMLKGEARGVAKGVAKGMARILVRHAIEHNVTILGSAAETEDVLTTGADENTLYLMVEDMPTMVAHGNIASFMRSHGIEIPGRGK